MLFIVFEQNETIICNPSDTLCKNVLPAHLCTIVTIASKRSTKNIEWHSKHNILPTTTRLLRFNIDEVN